MSLFCAPAAFGAIFVSTAGSDVDGNGSKEKPFASLERAINAVSQTEREIVFSGGVYEFKNSARLDNAGNEKAELIIRGADGENVSFLGGKRIAASNLKKVDDKAILSQMRDVSKGTLCYIDLKKFGLNEYGKMRQRGFSSPSNPMQMEAFYSGAKTIWLARWPNKGILDIGEVKDVGYIRNSKADARYENKDKTVRGAKFTAAHEIPEYWYKHDDIWIAGNLSLGWADDHQLIKSVDRETKLITLSFPHAYGVMSSVPKFTKSRQDISARGYYVYNLLEEIDEPYEYYIDRKNGIFYIMLKDAPKPTDYFDFSTLESPILAVAGSKNIRIKNITFAAARGNGISLSDSEDIKIENCVFENFGQKGILTAVKNADIENRYIVSNCKFFNNGSGGAAISGGNRKTLKSAKNLIENCEFSNNCRIQKNYAAGVSIGGVGGVVRHCEFRDGFHQLLTFSGNDHTIEYCIFADACHETSDMGAIYTGRNPSNKGISIRCNFFTNVRADNELSKVAAVYIDDGSGGMDISRNIFANCGTPGEAKAFGAIFFHGGTDNIVHKNVFINCEISANHAPWDKKRWQKVFGKEYLYRLKDEVDIDSEPYKKYASLKDFFNFDIRRVNFMTDNLLFNSSFPTRGDFHLDNRYNKLSVDGEISGVKKWTLSDVAKHFSKNPLVKEILAENIGIVREKK